MSGKQFNLRISAKVQKRSCHKNNAEAKVARKKITAKEEQLKAAVEWCEEHNVRGYSAVKSGLFPLVKNRRTIDKRLDGVIVTGKEKEYCSILTVEEEELIVNFVKNKNRSYQGVNKSDLTKEILNVLKVRQHLNRKKGGRSYKMLSSHALTALATGTLSRSFWRRWNAKHTDITMKRQGNVSVKRALNCTVNMAIEHLDGLAVELQEAEFFTNAVKVKPGIWTGDIDTSRIFNHDETPQFINYGVDGTPSGLVFAGKGEACKKLQNENRESITIQPFVSFSGDICLCQVIFAATGITSHMAPQDAVDKIENLIISNTKRGSSDNASLLGAYKQFDRYLTENNIERPVVIVSDGHSSRFNYEVMKFLMEKSMRLFISPPDTTGITQLLDQVNKMLHLAYKTEKENIFTPEQTINREGFMVILGNAWEHWATKETLIKAAKRVGVTKEGLSIEYMQKEKMAQSDLCFDDGQDDSISTQVLNSPRTPKSSLRSSADDWKRKYEQLKERYDEDIADRSIILTEVQGLLSVNKIKRYQPSTNSRLTQVYGSMTGKGVISLTKKISDEKEKKIIQKEMTENEKRNMKDKFFRCKEKCVCENDDGKCDAFGLRECPSCHNVLKSVCSKIICRLEDGSKPAMINGAGQGSRSRRARYQEDESSDEEDSFNDLADDGHQNSDMESDKSVNNECLEENMKIGDFVKIINGLYKDYYAVILNLSYGDEFEIQYFENKYGNWVLRKNDFDSREPEDLMKVDADIDKRGHYTFSK